MALLAMTEKRESDLTSQLCRRINRDIERASARQRTNMREGEGNIRVSGSRREAQRQTCRQRLYK